jgi:hypothetical protein
VPGKRGGNAMYLKLLDFGKPNNPFGEIIGRRRKLAWPVDAYRVTLPVPDNSDGLNMFERVILKIIDACGIQEAETLAREICIPVEMVNFVLLRLKDKEFIDEDNEIINQRRSIWKKENTPKFTTALAFRELATGKTLPFLHLLEDENSLKKKEGEKKTFRITWDKKYKGIKPEPGDVIQALGTMKKRSAVYGGYRQIPTINQIIIADEPEPYYIECLIAIQKSDAEFRIANPFGGGFSRILENSFSYLLGQDENLDKWLMDWKQKLRQSNSEPNGGPELTKKLSFDNDKNWEYYGDLLYSLLPGKNKQFRSIEKIYSALEWALFYSCIRRQYDVSVNKLKFTAEGEHSGILETAAKKTGLDLPRNVFHPVPEGKLEDFLEGKADMDTLISITLLMAENDPSHPLHEIVKKYPDFIIKLFEIKKKRDDQRHAKGKARRNTAELPEDDFMREIITVLLPDIRFTEEPAASADSDSAADLMLDARTNIQNEFGFKHFNRLGTDLQDRLTGAECFWLSYNDGDNALDFINDLYAALQAMFRKILTRTLPPEIKDSEFIKCAQEKAIRAGLVKPPESPLPESLRTVKLRVIKETLQGNDQTLGSCAVAFLIASNDGSLKTIPQIQPSFISDIDKIIKLSAHGNKPLFLKKDEIGKVRKSAYSTIKTLLEVEEWISSQD